MSRSKHLGFAYLLVLASLFFLASPAWAASPFGSLGGIAGGATGGGGVLPLHGWCLDDDGVRAVDIFVDGNLVGRAQYGRRRPDVARSFPGFPDSENGGFAFHLDSTRFLNGLHTVQPRCTSNTGEVSFLAGKVLEFTNTVHNLVPFGKIDFPNRNAQMLGDCENTGRWSIVEGWALDAGIEIGDEGMSWVELMVDGSILGDTRTTCVFRPETGGLTDCLGLLRPDIEQQFPGLKDSPNSGFRFALDVGALIQFGFVRGFHVLTIRGGDISGQVSNMDEIPVVFLCDSDIANEGAFGRVGRPLDGLEYNGVLTVVGWALDWEGVAKVEIWVDGRKIGDASYGGIRLGVTSRYPGYPDSLAPGFAFDLDTRPFVNGLHQFQVFVEDEALPARRSLIGERTFFVNNP